jgi:hypothetical protein
MNFLRWKRRVFFQFLQMLILSLVPFRPTAHIGVDRIRSNVLPTTRRRSCYAWFGRCERGLAKYTRCVSVAARGVASSLLSTPFQLPGASFEVIVIRPLALCPVCATIPLPSLCGILYTVPSPICLFPFLSFSFSSFVFVLSFGAFGRVSDERTSKQVYTRVHSHVFANTRSSRTLSLRNIGIDARIAASVKIYLKSHFFQIFFLYTVKVQRLHHSHFSFHIL